MAMREMPGKRDLPIYVLYDEFGHSAIPNFVAVNDHRLKPVASSYG